MGRLVVQGSNDQSATQENTMKVILSFKSRWSERATDVSRKQRAKALLKDPKYRALFEALRKVK